jgi:small subunit ribosomal protein S4e
MKRMFAPHNWFLDKCAGVYATRPSTGPHKLRECLPLNVLLRQRLKYALNNLETIKICRDKDANIKIDNRVRRDHRFPLGLMDVVTIDKTGENFRMLYDVKGRFQAVRIDEKEAQFKLCKVVRKRLGKNKVPYIVTHDGRTIRYPHPDIKQNDSVKLNLDTNEVDGVIKFDNGATVFVSGGNNIGRVGILSSIEAHAGSYDIAHVKDSQGRVFATRKDNIFIIGEGKNPLISLPKRLGIAVSLLEERNERMGQQAADDDEEEEEDEESDK